jgi:hypothetical protein
MAFISKGFKMGLTLYLILMFMITNGYRIFDPKYYVINLQANNSF